MAIHVPLPAQEGLVRRVVGMALVVMELWALAYALVTLLTCSMVAGEVWAKIDISMS